MNIYYQGILGSYSNTASQIAQKNLNIKGDLIGVDNFEIVWQKIGEGNIGILPIENSYAGSIHTNLYNFLRHDHEIIGEIVIDINHCLLSNHQDIKEIKKVYSHPQALAQCYEFLKSNDIQAISFSDTASAAVHVQQNKEEGAGAIASRQAGEIHGLNIIQENIQDQDGNKTRFVIVKSKNLDISYPDKKSKISLIFETKNIPGALYKCLGGFATNFVNLSKIESLPSLKDPFTYIFWIDFAGSLQDTSVKNALEELSFFSNYYKILGQY